MRQQQQQQHQQRQHRQRKQWKIFSNERPNNKQKFQFSVFKENFPAHVKYNGDLSRIEIKMILLVKSSTKRRRRIAFQFTIRLVPLVLIVIIQMLARWVQSIEIQRPEVAAQSIVKSKFPFDSIIWDEKSLYNQATKVANNNRNNHISTSIRAKRSATTKDSAQNQQQLVDACQSKMEILTPYYATNSKGNLRTIVNSELMQQAIQVETCVR